MMILVVELMNFKKCYDHVIINLSHQDQMLVHMWTPPLVMNIFVVKNISQCFGEKIRC